METLDLKEFGKNLSRQMEVIREITDSINTHQDSQGLFHIILDRLATHLDVNAAAMMLLNEKSNQFEYIAGRGFRTPVVKHTRKNNPDSLAGRVINSSEIFYINNPEPLAEDPEVSKLLRAEGFIAYMGIPMVICGKNRGVIELFSKTEISPDLSWQRFLRILSGQAGHLVCRQEEFMRYNNAIIKLDQAYSDALDGWVRAVELRDHYTFKHTERTTDLTLQLSTRLGVPDEMLVHVRRGAMLHDVGKLVIPDSILLKPGPLNEEEWVTMRQHPIFAYKLLKPVQFLQQAITIPYYHHEKWDGTGYPRGLKQEEIPLEARIFTVVDVWDALTSDRPYRTAWKEEEALSYIEANSNIEFDPDVVREFIAIVNQETLATEPVEIKGE